MIPGIRITVRGDKKRLEAVLSRIERTSKGAKVVGGKKAISVFYKVLKSDMRGGVGVLKPSMMALSRRRLGKLKGKWPAVPAYRSHGTTPLMRSGTLYRSIVMKKTGSFRYRVGIRDGAVYPDGRSVAGVAAAMEFGVARIAVKLSKRMSTYLDRLREGNHRMKAGGSGGIAGSKSGQRRFGGSGRRSIGSAQRTFFVKIPARPVWSNAFAKAMRPATNAFVQSYLKDVGLL